MKNVNLILIMDILSDHVVYSMRYVNHTYHLPIEISERLVTCQFRGELPAGFDRTTCFEWRYQNDTWSHAPDDESVATVKALHQVITKLDHLYRRLYEQHIRQTGFKHLPMQIEAYRLKYAEAQQYLAAGCPTDLTDYMLIAASAQAKAISPEAAAKRIIIMHEAQIYAIKRLEADRETRVTAILAD